MKRALKFLHLTTFYPPYSFGGDAMYVYRLAHALADAGHEVDVVHCVDSYHLLHPGEPELSFQEHPGVKRHELRSSYRWLSPLLTQQTGRPVLKRGAIRRLLAAKRYDVIQFHNTSLLGPAVLELEGGAPAVKMYMTHEHWLICPMHVLWKFGSRPCEKPECVRCVVKGRRPPQLWRYTGLLERAARCVDQFVSPSRFTARMHADRGFSQPVAHLPYFISRVDNDWRDPAPRPQEAPYFLFVGRLELIKGLQTLIQLWKSRDPGYDLLVAGAGAYERELRVMAGLHPRIKFLGPLPQRELGALYYHALASIIPSITYETFGMINIESFARKTPVIARDLGALPEVVHDSGGGFVYRTDEELLAAMRRIAASPRLRAELGQKGYGGFLRWWTKEAHMELYFRFLRQNAEKKFGSAPWDQPAVAASGQHS